MELLCAGAACEGDGTQGKVGIQVTHDVALVDLTRSFKWPE